MNDVLVFTSQQREQIRQTRVSLAQHFGSTALFFAISERAYVLHTETSVIAACRTRMQQDLVAV
jgi:hypothetical protein